MAIGDRGKRGTLHDKPKKKGKTFEDLAQQNEIKETIMVPLYSSNNT
jgi:hypothetical protein